MEKVNRKKGPTEDSKTSQRRRNRGFISLEQSSRMHRRAKRRSQEVRTISGTLYEPGEKKLPSLQGGKLSVYLANAGGSLHYHKA